MGERSVEQATRERANQDQIEGSSTQQAPVAFEVPERLGLVDSTNRYLADLVRSGMPGGAQVPEGYAVVAEQQSAGRGRLARRWEAPRSSAVLCSILFRTGLTATELHLLNWAVALSALSACRQSAGVELSLKWPNDLLAPAEFALAGRRGAPKVAGILSEVLAPGAQKRAEGAEEALRAVVVGIGINVNWPPGWPPADADDPDLASLGTQATALNRLSGREIDRDDLLERMLDGARRFNAALRSEEGRRSVASQYRHSCSTIGREVRVQLADETVLGRAVDLDESGCLLVATNMCIRTISAGDVIHLR
jgi:BirA family biotin operon repressor/biotin-[acetyl-CoA-carboxylase] ligase